MSRITNKTTLAREQLEDAIQLFLKGRYVSSLTLAGAAEGIFSGLLRARGIETSAETSVKSTHKFRQLIGTGQVFDSFLYNCIYNGRNRAKHHDHDRGEPEKVLFDRFGEAFMLLQHAVANADRLGMSYRNKKAYQCWFQKLVCPTRRSTGRAKRRRAS